MQPRIMSEQQSCHDCSSDYGWQVQKEEDRTCDEALGAVVGHVIIIPAFVEHAADHVHPCATCITRHPALFLLIVILPLLQLALAHLQLHPTTSSCRTVLKMAKAAATGP